MKKISLISVLIMIAAVVFQSCEQVENTPKGKYADGVFITNEGAFQQGNGSVSFYSVQGDTVSNYIFEKANGRTLGDIVQSLTFVDDKAYICVNASNKIEIANAEDFTEIGVIDNVAGVRYLKALNAQKAYASAWGDGGQVKVIDLTINTVTKSINVGNGPENMAIISDKLYVANSGGFTEDNTISVVDTENDNILKTITLDGDNPTDLLVDNNDNLWVLCSGKTIFDANWVPIDHTAAKLIKINTTTDEVGQSVILSQNEHPKNLELSTDGNYLYYGGGFGFSGIYKIDINSLSVPSNSLISKYFYGFKVYKTGNIFATEATSYTDNGKMYRYKPDGTLIKEYTVGIGPNGASFKKDNGLLLIDDK